jgi:hypothetical protein
MRRLSFRCQQGDDTLTEHRSATNLFAALWDVETGRFRGCRLVPPCFKTGFTKSVHIGS